MLILPLILSLAGVGGIGGYIALRLFAPGLLAMIGGVLKAVPLKVWLAIAALAFVCGLLWWHNHEVKAAYNRGYATATVERDAKWSDAFDTMHGAAQAYAAAFNQQSATLSNQIGARHEQDLRAIADRADALRLHGPGRATATCTRPGGSAGLPATARLNEPPGGAAHDGVAGLPDEVPMAIVPWPDLVQRSEDADADRAEVIAWREWFDANRKAWADYKAKLQRDLPKPAFGNSDRGN